MAEGAVDFQISKAQTEQDGEEQVAVAICCTVLVNEYSAIFWVGDGTFEPSMDLILQDPKNWPYLWLKSREYTAPNFFVGWEGHPVILFL